MNTPTGFEPAFAAPPELASNAVCFVWRDDKILVRAGEPPTLPAFADLMRLSIDGARHYLGRLEGIDCLAIRVAGDSPEPAGCEWRGLRTLFLQVPDPLLALAGRAFQIVEWDRSHQFCGRCGSRLRTGPASGRRSVPSAGMSSTRAYRRQ